MPSCGVAGAVCEYFRVTGLSGADRFFQYWKVNIEY
jgi:hypothetical protein